jgi:hypothetical protein
VPTRDFLDEERGVMLLLRKDLMGVDWSSCAGVLARGVLPTLLRTVRAGWALLAEATEGARRGVTGVFAARVLANVGFKGRPVLEFRRSGTGMVHGPRWIQVCIIGQYGVFGRRACSTAAAVCCFSGVVWAIGGVLPDSTRPCRIGGGDSRAPR